MPSQARDNSWSCDYCGTEGFRSFDDVKAHEHECQPSPRKRSRSGSADHNNAGMAPLSAAVAAQMGGEYERPKPRRFTIMAPDDMHQHQLDMADALACQNLEVFEAGPEFEGGGPRLGPIVPGQAGIRCLHCAQQPTDEYNMYFPGSVEALGSGIQMVADRHFVRCPAAPVQVREEFQRASEKRTRAREEGSRSTTDEERSQMAMTTYCSMFCRNCGIVDKFPPHSGLSFVDPQQLQQRYAPTPHHARSGEVPYPPFPGPRGPPFPSMMAQMGDSIAPTPLARSSKDPQDRASQPNFEGGFPAFPTAYASGTPRIRTDMGPVGPTSQRGPAQDSPFPGYAMSPYGAPPQPQGEFPYFQDTSSSWSCKYCSDAPPQYRDQGSIWNGTEPPPGTFINQHLQVCRSYNQGNMPTAPSPATFQGQPAGYGFPPPSSYGSGPPPQHGGQGAPSPMPFYSTGPPEGDPNFPYAPPPPASSNEPRQGMPPRSEGPSGAVPQARLQIGLPQPGGAGGEVAAQQAIDYLVAAEQDMYRQNPALAAIEQLVLDEDKMLLTDYFFYLMKQLRVCRFAEADRKTRGGKRENIAVGYGGLQCIHCAGATNARKFFWSNVDRLANSFAEIPAHVLKCRRCPNQTKTAILDLKARHPEQMAKLPRGSQKVFFRRMWRRLHDPDPQPEGSVPDEAKESEDDTSTVGSPKPAQEPPVEERISPAAQHLERTGSSPGTSTDESAILFERPTDEAAKALAASLTLSDPPSPSSRILLGIPEDKEWLSDMDCFIRRNLEVFCATSEDVEIAQLDRKYPINTGQVGIRCIHCALTGRTGCRGNAVAYPYSINGIYEAVREFERLHLGACTNLPPAVKQKLDNFKGSSSLSSVLRKYYVLAANALGMADTADGIRSGGESVPLGSSVAFAAFTDEPTVSEEMRKKGGDGRPAEFIETGPTASESRKRKQPEEASIDHPPADAKPSAAAKNDDLEADV